MKKSLLLFFSVMFFISEAGVPDIRCAVERFPPYFMDLRSGTPGFAVELIKFNLPQNVCRITFVYGQWGPVLTNLHSSRTWIKAFAGAARGDVSARFTSVPLYTVRSGIFVRKDSAVVYRGTKSLLQGKIGLVKDYSHTDELDRFTGEHEADGKIIFQTTDRNVRSLLRGDVMFVIDNVDSVYASLKKMQRPATDVLLLKKLDNATPFFLVFCWDKTLEGPVRIFNENMKKFITTPAYAALRKKYGLEPLSLQTKGKNVVKNGSNREKERKKQKKTKKN